MTHRPHVSHPHISKTPDLEVRLARTQEEVIAAQALRYRVFYQEMGAKPTAEVLAAGLDYDTLDAVCDHLLVIDKSKCDGDDVRAGIVGTYRLIRRSAAKKHGSFYSEQEYDISRLIAYHGEILELGRSCIDAAYRTRPTMQLLWKGLAAYVTEHEIDIMFGCASLPGTDVAALAMPLSYLYYHHLAPPALRAKALPHRFVDMKLVPPEQVDPQNFNSLKPLLNNLPPLIKGYLRVGGFVGDGAVVDEQFNTTDVCIIVKTDMITGKYSRHYDLSRGSQD
jgi:L-ornithine Nalpha-acyltransferase